jgi:endonuclease-3
METGMSETTGKTRIRKRRSVAAGEAEAKGRPVARAKRAPLGLTLASGARPSPDEIREMFRRFRDANPHPTTELEHLNPFTLLVAVVLSAQATDAGVNKATRRLFEIADTPAKMAALGEAAVQEHIKTVNFHRTKARNVVALARKLVEEHGGEVPRSREALEALPGAGRKTANVILNTAFCEPTMAVDTHIFRVSNRTGLAPGKDPLAVEHGLERVVPDEFKLHAHHWLILHGRYVCKAKKPECWRCLVADLCKWPEKSAAP